MLDALARSNVRATFFMVGEHVHASPRLVQAVLDKGHEIQFHCHQHVRHSDLSEVEIEHDTRAGLAALARFGVRPSLWRTPWGNVTDGTRSVAKAKQLTLVRWDIDTQDWSGRAGDEILERVTDQIVGAGSVLMHDALGPGATRRHVENTVELIPRLAAAALDVGVEIAPLAPPPPPASDLACASAVRAGSGTREAS